MAVADTSQGVCNRTVMSWHNTRLQRERSVSVLMLNRLVRVEHDRQNALLGMPRAVAHRPRGRIGRIQQVAQQLPISLGLRVICMRLRLRGAIRQEVVDCNDVVLPITIEAECDLRIDSE